MRSKVTADFEAWQRIWPALGVAPPANEAYRALQQCYAQSSRAYHTLIHIGECLTYFTNVHEVVDNPAAVEAAIWFHDVIYDPRRSDNEAASAAWATMLLQAAGVAPTTIAQIQQLIEDTAHRWPPATCDGALLVDIDLSILGAPVERFIQYEAAIRHEYAWVPWPTYCQRRTALLQQFLDRPTIYQTGTFQRSLEAQARQNLARSIQSLAGA